MHVEVAIGENCPYKSHYTYTCIIAKGTFVQIWQIIVDDNIALMADNIRIKTVNLGEMVASIFSRGSISVALVHISYVGCINLWIVIEYS